MKSILLGTTLFEIKHFFLQQNEAVQPESDHERYMGELVVTLPNAEFKNLPLHQEPNLYFEITDDYWEVPREKVTIERVIGTGAFGLVARATATDICGTRGPKTVAVKMLKGASFLCEIFSCS